MDACAVAVGAKAKYDHALELFGLTADESYAALCGTIQTAQITRSEGICFGLINDWQNKPMKLKRLLNAEVDTLGIDVWAKAHTVAQEVVEELCAWSRKSAKLSEAD